MKSENVTVRRSDRVRDVRKSEPKHLFRPEEILHCEMDAIQQRRQTGRSNPRLDSALPELLRLQERGGFDREELLETLARLGLDDPSSWLLTPNETKLSDGHRERA